MAGVSDGGGTVEISTFSCSEGIKVDNSSFDLSFLGLGF